MPVWRSTVAFAGLVAGAWLFVPALVAADEPARGQLLVPGDHHLAGETIEITGYGLDPGAKLSLFLENGAHTITLGHGVVGADGTFSTFSAVPVNFPEGYSTVVATDEAGRTSWKTVILVGERAEGPGASGVATDSGGPFIDPAAIGLAMVVVGLLVFAFAAFRYVRARRPSSALDR